VSGAEGGAGGSQTKSRQVKPNQTKNAFFFFGSAPGNSSVNNGGIRLLGRVEQLIRFDLH